MSTVGWPARGPSGSCHPPAPAPLSLAREYCEDDIKKLCKKERDAIKLREGFAADAQVITCLEVRRWHGGRACGRAGWAQRPGCLSCGPFAQSALAALPPWHAMCNAAG